jgi:NADH-quinone oxidoreductase subunit L
MAVWVWGAALPLVPLVAALAGLLLPLRARTAAAALGIAGATVTLVASVVLAVRVTGPVDVGRVLVDFGGLPVTVGVRLDPAAALVAVAVAVVALAVQVYSVAYLHGDGRYPPYAAQVSLFTAAMFDVVVARDLVQLLIGWEVMGICSYLLIGHDRTLPQAPAAAVKAFLVTRVGDVGFWLGIALLGVRTGSFAIGTVTARAGHAGLSGAVLTLACLLLLAGVAGKSAQFPLHTWLPDAMAGPTPISALIHAATMVAAGIYVVTRVYPLYVAAPAALAVLGVMAAVTMLLGALAASAQDDIKRVLAWSTVSQIAYMAGGLAVGAAPAALFHLLTHAAFKALLFLGAGCVIHAVGSNLMSDMGGLRRALPATFWSVTIGLGALAGVVPLSGFWSKDALLSAAFEARTGEGPAAGWVGWLVWLTGLLTAAVTAWYATRLWLRVFHGAPRGALAAASARPAAAVAAGPGGAGHVAVHRPGPVLTVPVVVLAVPAALLGFAALSPAFADRLAVPGAAPAHLVDLGSSLLPLLLVALGAVAAWWAARGDADPALVPALRPLFAAGLGLDAVQDALVVRPVRALARAVRRGDERIVDGAVTATGRGTFRLGGAVARLHRAGVPRAATAVLGGALLVGLVAALLGGLG